MLKAENLGKIYSDGALGLESLDLLVEPGEIYCLLGANGAGKTTTINLFLNFIEPTSGACFIDGINVVRNPVEAKKKVAFLSENVRLYGNFTARDNLAFFAKVAGRRNLKEDDLDEIMDSAGLPSNSFDRRVKAFSKGMRQKLGIAVAITKQSPALLLDEPLSGLDPSAAADLVQTLRKLRRQGKAILMSTHDIFRAKELADRIGIMADGRKIAERDRQQLQNENLELLYLSYVRPRDSEKARQLPSL